MDIAIALTNRARIELVFVLGRFRYLIRFRAGGSEHRRQAQVQKARPPAARRPLELFRRKPCSHFDLAPENRLKKKARMK
ncbi:MAG: hypothetical protein C4324_12065 [Blastocatellia bacterium]